jgi:hypothetical protein
MVQITLNDDELVILRSTIAAALIDLGEEIVGTDNAEYRRGLRERRQHLSDVLVRLGVLGPPVSV